MGNSKRDKYFKKHEKAQNSVSVSVNEQYPRFSFEFCFIGDRAIDRAEKKTKQAIIDKVIFLSRNTWQEIKGLSREQGFEKIPKKNFDKIPNIPQKFSELKDVDVFRLPSKLGRMIGYILEDTFYVVWIDTKFDMYKH